jgi:hypothetical protein
MSFLPTTAFASPQRIAVGDSVGSLWLVGFQLLSSRAERIMVKIKGKNENTYAFTYVFFPK